MFAFRLRQAVHHGSQVTTNGYLLRTYLGKYIYSLELIRMEHSGLPGCMLVPHSKYTVISTRSSLAPYEQVLILRFLHHHIAISTLLLKTDA